MDPRDVNVRSEPATGRRLRRDEQQARTRASLLAAAASLFGQAGFHAVSLEQVAEAAGFSKGAVYSNFASKQELLAALLAERCEHSLLTLADEVREAGTVADRLDRVGRTATERLRTDRDWVLLFVELWTHAARGEPLRRDFADLYRRARAGIAELIEAAAARTGADLSASPAMLASLCVAAMDGLAMQTLIEPRQVPPDAAATALRLLLAELLAPDERQASGNAAATREGTG